MNEQSNGSKPRFLVAEDNPGDARLIGYMLDEAFSSGCIVENVGRFEEVLNRLDQADFDGLLLDLELPDQSGIDNVHTVNQMYPDLPIVVLTGHEALELAIGSLQGGAQDYLSKNSVTPQILARSLHYSYERKSIENKLKIALDDAAIKNAQLERQSKIDPLTGLANRSHFRNVAQAVLDEALSQDMQVALLYFDLNEFKKVNDTYGHQIGDQLLQQVAMRLQVIVGDGDFLARVGGDEFVIVSRPLLRKREIYPLISRLRKQFEPDFYVGSHQLVVSTAIGVAFFPTASDLDLLVKHADFAMYEAKKHPNLSTLFYSNRLSEQYARLQKVESFLGAAVENHEFYSTFQPIVSVDDPSVVHLESLARWHSDELGDVRPDEFIPVSEGTPVINEITQAITEQLAQLHRMLTARGRRVHRMSINVSASQLSNPSFCQRFLQWLEANNLQPNHVCIELTERQIVDNMKQCKTQILALRHYDVEFSLDDFGSGMSSFQYLRTLPVDYLKIDGGLIQDIASDRVAREMVALAR